MRLKSQRNLNFTASKHIQHGAGTLRQGFRCKCDDLDLSIWSEVEQINLVKAVSGTACFGRCLRKLPSWDKVLATFPLQNSFPDESRFRRSHRKAPETGGRCDWYCRVFSLQEHKWLLGRWRKQSMGFSYELTGIKAEFGRITHRNL